MADVQLPEEVSGNELRFYGERMQLLLSGLSQVIRGKEEFLKKIIVCACCGGHVLLEDVPGLGKTTVAKTLAKLISGSLDTDHFRRIQFTPDLLPYDITGVDIFDQESGGFVFSPGPVFANIVLADEINRASPKVQSALLEVMAENQVTVGNKTYPMDQFFLVIATQNPIEMEGTYPLPAAQLDRFMMRLSLGYPDFETEVAILQEDPSHTIMPDIDTVLDTDKILEIRDAIQSIRCDDKLVRVIAAVAEAVRNHNRVELGISPRGALMLLHASRAWALMHDRDYVIDQDLLDMGPAVLCHRMIFKDRREKKEVFIREVILGQLKKVDY